MLHERVLDPAEHLCLLQCTFVQFYSNALLGYLFLLFVNQLDDLQVDSFVHFIQLLPGVHLLKNLASFFLHPELLQVLLQLFLGSGLGHRLLVSKLAFCLQYAGEHFFFTLELLLGFGNAEPLVKEVILLRLDVLFEDLQLLLIVLSHRHPGSNCHQFLLQVLVFASTAISSACNRLSPVSTLLGWCQIILLFTDEVLLKLLSEFGHDSLLVFFGYWHLGDNLVQ